ncbi:MAG: VWA domain-containing protein [Acidobacteriia bacterium]|nr:VWA domain-containing protein [Terriglobia bacterium]
MTRTTARLAMCVLLAVSTRAQAQTQQPAPPAAAAPQGAAPQQQPPRIIVRTPVVIVPVTVKDGRGQLVAGLQKDDFRVFSDEVEQQIATFSSEAYPLSAVVLIDNDLAERAAAQVQKSLTAISAGFGSADEVAVVTYDQYPNTVTDFSFNNDLLFTQLKRLELGSHSSTVAADPTTAGPIGSGTSLPRGAQGPGQPFPGSGPQVHGTQRYKKTTALHDAIYAAGDMLKARGRDRRKIIFLISDGTNTDHNTHTFDETLHALLSADVSVYSISVTRPLPVGKSLVQRGASDLEKYAAKSGGDTYYASKQPDLERLYSNVTEQARNQYTLTFSPQSANKTVDYHSIEIRVKRPDLSVNARDGYYQSAISVGR